MFDINMRYRYLTTKNNAAWFENGTVLLMYEGLHRNIDEHDGTYRIST